MDRLERVAVEPVEPLPPAFAHVDSADFSENAQVLRDLRLGQPELNHEIVHGALAAGEYVEDLPSPRLGHGIECVSGRRCSWHMYIIYLYRNISTRSYDSAVERAVHDR